MPVLSLNDVVVIRPLLLSFVKVPVACSASLKMMRYCPVGKSQLLVSVTEVPTGAPVKVIAEPVAQKLLALRGTRTQARYAIDHISDQMETV